MSNPDHKPGKPLMELQVGDEVMYCSSGIGARPQVAEVTKVTAKFIIINHWDSQKFRREDGLRAGKLRYHGSIFPVTVEHLQEIDAHEEQSTARRLLDEVRAKLRHGSIERAQIQTLIKALSTVVEPK